MLILLIACAGKGGDTAQPVDKSFSYPTDDVLTIGHVQVKGTHNSYHVATDPSLVTEWDYTQPPLDVQARDLGVRQFELDVYYDAAAGTFAVEHVPGFDELTTCASLDVCLGILDDWSRDNPAHLPLVILLEPKDDVSGDSLSGHFDVLDAAILDAWPRERVLTPDDLQGDAATLREAVVDHGWPVLGELRGKAIFALLDRGDHRDEYSADQASVAGRVMFPLGDADSDVAAFFLRDDPVADTDIPDLVQAGFLVRTRADAGTEGPAGDTSRLEAALASGAQYLSTDYPGPVDGLDYVVEIPGGTPARCNPLTAPAVCTSEALEDPQYVKY